MLKVVLRSICALFVLAGALWWWFDDTPSSQANAVGMVLLFGMGLLALFVKRGI